MMFKDKRLRGTAELLKKDRNTKETKDESTDD